MSRIPEEKTEKAAAFSPGQFRFAMFLGLTLCFMPLGVRESIGYSAAKISYATAKLGVELVAGVAGGVYNFVVGNIVWPEDPKNTKGTTVLVEVGGQTIAVKVPPQ